jgi:hypothetical protein
VDISSEVFISNTLKIVCLFYTGINFFSFFAASPVTQEQREHLHRGVGLHDQPYNIPVFLSQFPAKSVLTVTAEVPDDLFKIDRQFHRFLVDQQMLVPGHDLLCPHPKKPV